MFPSSYVLLKADKKLGPGTFRLARVSAVQPDEEGDVRTVTIQVRSRRNVRKTVMEDIRMAVQRLCVLLPIEE